jgi:hypothetical protein
MEGLGLRELEQGDHAFHGDPSLHAPMPAFRHPTADGPLRHIILPDGRRKLFLRNDLRCANMRPSSVLLRLLGFSLLGLLGLVTALVILEPLLSWLLVVVLGFLWIYGFSLSHAYVLMHDGIGSARR